MAEAYNARGGVIEACQYDEHQAGAVRGERVFPVGAALVARGPSAPGTACQEVIEASPTGRRPCSARAKAAMKNSIPLGSVRLLAPIENPPRSGQRRRTTRRNAAENARRLGRPRIAPGSARTS